MLAAAKYIGAGFFFYNSIKEIVNILFLLSCYFSTFIFYVLYVMSVGFYLTVIIALLLIISSEFLQIDKNTLYETFGFNDMLCQLSSGLIGSSKSDKPKLNRLTKLEQSQYVISEKLEQILVGLILGDLWTNKRGDNTRLRFLQGACHKDYIYHLYDLFQEIFSQSPKLVTSVRHKKRGMCMKLYYFILIPCLVLPKFAVLFIQQV
jgi:hypothetical protein